jgi:hypothetical protein
MVDSNTSTGQWAEWMGNPWKLFQAASDYCVDAWQRAILYADIERQVGDQYQAQRSVKVPHVLSFPFEPVLFGTAQAGQLRHDPYPRAERSADRRDQAAIYRRRSKSRAWTGHRRLQAGK